MSDDESFDEFYAKLNDIVNSAYNLGEIYDQAKIVRKILRFLTKNFPNNFRLIIDFTKVINKINNVIKFSIEFVKRLIIRHPNAFKFRS